MSNSIRPLAIAAAAACLLAPALAQATTCDGYFEQSRTVTDLMTKAYAAMNAHDEKQYPVLLPQLKVQLNALPATEIKAEACKDHINAYTLQQYEELSTLRAHNLATGFPDTLPIVKQPDLNQAGLAYAVGWMSYESKDYAGAIAAYGKGLAMFPHNHELQNEYAAALLQQGEGAETVAFADKVLSDTFDYSDVDRAKLYVARGVGLVLTGDKAGAADAFKVAQLYNYTDDVKNWQDQLAATDAKK